MKYIVRQSNSLLTAAMRWLLFFLFGLVTLGQLERIELPQGRALYLHEIVLVVFLTISFIVWRKQTKGRCRVLKALVTVDAWILFSIAVEFFLTKAQIVTPFLYAARFNTYILLGVALYVGRKFHAFSRDFVQWLITGSIGVIAFFGWVQYLFVPDTRSLMFLGWDNHYLRLIGTLFDPGFTGIVLALGALFLGSRLFFNKEKGMRFALLQWTWLLCVSALLFTYSRASFAAFIAGSFFLFLRQQRKAHLIVILFFLLGALCLPRPRSEGARLERTASIVARIETVQKSAKGLSPIEVVIGRGWYSQKDSSVRLMGGSQVPSHNSAPENSFVFVFSSLGIVGVLLFVWFVWEVVRFSSPSTEVFVVLLAIGTHALFSNTLFYPFVLLYAASVIGVYAGKRN